MATIVCVPHPIAGCLKVAETIIGEDRVWNPGNDDNRTAVFLSALPSLRADLEQLASSMKCMASLDHEVLNTFFATNGFPEIKFKPFTPDQFGVGSILDIALQWINEGEKSRLYVHDEEAGRSVLLPAVTMESGGPRYRVGESFNFVGQFLTNNGFDVFMVVAPTGAQYSTAFDVARAVEEIRSQMVRIEDWKDAQFPMVDLNVEDALEWILGLNTVTNTGEVCRVIEAQQITRFKMDHKGAHLQSAAKMVMCLESMHYPDIYINQPFLLWITKSGEPLSAPVMSAFVDKDSWKDPNA